MSLPSDREELIFSAALALPAMERKAYLQQACVGQPELRQRMEKLLSAHDAAGAFLETPLAPERATLGLEMAGDLIDRYKLLEKIGEGGCGVVYLAEQQEPVRRRVALKIIKLGMDTKEVIARFEAERQALALMDHPHISRVLDAGATKTGRPYFVMELVPGTKLTAYCDEAKVSLEERLELFVQVCQAIQHAHQKGIIHRDIKPSNVLVTLHDGVPVPKVIDFGVAKATQGRLTDKTLFTAFEQFVGTPAYMSPEQAEKSDWDVDTRSDIYSLGVLLYELLTGCTPLDSESLRRAGLNEMRRLILETDPPRPSSRLTTLEQDTLTEAAEKRRIEPAKLIRRVHGDLDWVVMKCLEKDRRRRYGTVNGLALEIERYLKHEPIEARPPSAYYTFQKFARRHRAGMWAAVFAMTTLLTATAVSLWLAVRARRAESKARTEAKTSEAVLNFLRRDLLAEASPNQQPDRELKLRTVLDRAATKVDGAFPDEPLVEATLRETLADTYDSLGEYRSAQLQLEKARALRRSNLGVENTLTLRDDRNLVGVLEKQGKYNEAEPLALKTFGVLTRVFGPTHPDTLSMMSNLAAVYQGEGKLELAEEFYSRVYTANQRLLGPDHADTLADGNNLALVYRDRGRTSEAETLYTFVLDGLKRTLGSEHPTTLTTMANLASVMHDQGRFAEAEATDLKVLEIRKRILSPGHPSLLTSMYSLAVTYSDEGKTSEAEALLLQAVDLARQALGPEHPKTLIAMANLARTYDLEGKLPEATALNRQTLEIQKQTLGAEHPAVLIVMGNLANNYRRQGMLPEAEELQLQIVSVEKRVFGPEHPTTLNAMNGLGLTFLTVNKIDQAEEIFRSGLAIALKTSPDSWRTAQTKSLLGQTLMAEARYSEAEPLLLEGYEGLKKQEKKIPANNKAELAKAARQIQTLYTKWDKPAKAAEWERILQPIKPAPPP